MKRIKMRLAIGLALASASVANADTFDIGFQGVLSTNGSPVVDGAYELSVTLYDSDLGGSVIAGPIGPIQITTESGLFSATMPLDSSWLVPPPFLEVSIDGGDPLLPRLALSYSGISATAATLGGGAVNLSEEGNVGIGIDAWSFDALRLGGSIRAEGVVSQAPADGFAYRSNWISGHIPNWLGTGLGAEFYSLIGAEGDQWGKYAGYGVAVSDGIASPIVWCRQGGQNAFQVRRVIDPVQNPWEAGVVLHVSGSNRVGINTTNPVCELDVNGEAAVDVLRITGGSDLAEPFDVIDYHDQGIRPGMVVVIDPDHDGVLTPCKSAYDTAAAGVISGANGVAPGVVLSDDNEPMSMGEHAVAMAGRVWVLCDASFGPIRRGARITTSPTIGHGMAVGAEQDVPGGAVLGKAMSELEGGKGYVWMLVRPE